jgi:uncharacterized protein YdeI (YjbR/CyaY-like superfamily)
MDKLRFFSSPLKFRAWLERHHESAAELWVGFHKKGSGKPSITWPESVDQALCFGWIDGIRKGVDEDTYAIRFTPRKRTSTWSAVNIRRVKELRRMGLMHPAGGRAFEARADEKSAIYAYEQRRHPTLEPALERKFKASKRAWQFFQAQPPGYRKLATWWVVSAKKEETRLKRLAVLMEDCANGRRLAQLARPAGPR